MSPFALRKCAPLTHFRRAKGDNVGSTTNSATTETMEWVSKCSPFFVSSYSEATEHVLSQVSMDSGVENINTDVAALIEANTIRRVLAQVDLHFSNSMIESGWSYLTIGARQ